jgi:hypothetical protein
MFDFLEHAKSDAPFAKTRYFKSMDMLIFVTKDVPYTSELVDGALTLFWSPSGESLVGLKIKGFRHAFEEVKNRWGLADSHFVMMVEILKEALEIGGTDLLEDLEQERKNKYVLARNLVSQHQLNVSDIEKQIAA